MRVSLIQNQVPVAITQSIHITAVTLHDISEWRPVFCQTTQKTDWLLEVQGCSGLCLLLPLSDLIDGVVVQHIPGFKNFRRLGKGDPIHVCLVGPTCMSSYDKKCIGSTNLLQFLCSIRDLFEFAGKDVRFCE